jgi:hypothetical protein
LEGLPVAKKVEILSSEVPSPKADLSLNINGKVLVSSKNEKASSGVPSGASGYTQTELQLVENSMGK